jgi:hypothetical protein
VSKRPELTWQSAWSNAARWTKRLPQTSRTWLRFRGGAYSGANLFAFGNAKAAAAVALWRSVEQDRKKGWRMIARSVRRCCSAWCCDCARSTRRWMPSAGGSALPSARSSFPNPLAAVDVDKQADHALVTDILEGRA